MKKTEPNLGQNGPKSGPKLGFFCHFLKFDSLVFFDIVQECNLG